MYPSYPVLHFWQWIAHVFEDFFFVPLQFLRHLQDSTWWGANAVNFTILAVFFLLFFYWLFKLKIFHDYDKQHTEDMYR